MNGQTIMEMQAKREENIGRIREQFPAVEFPDPILEPIYFGRFEKNPVLGKKLIMDATTKDQWDVVSDKYTIKYHEEVLDDLLHAIPQEYGKPEFKVKFFQDRARMDITTTFPEARDEVNGSKIDPMIRLKNSYNRSVRVVFEFGAMELVCTNGLVRFRVKERNTAKHIQGALDRLQLENTINDALTAFSESKEIWKSWAKKQLNTTQVLEVVHKLPFSEKESEALILLPLLNHGKESVKALLDKKKATLWAVNSAATQMASKEITSEVRKMDLEGQIAKVIIQFAA